MNCEYPYYSIDKKVSFILNKGSLFSISLNEYPIPVRLRIINQFLNILDNEKDENVLRKSIPELMDKLCHSSNMPIEIIDYIVNNYIKYISLDYQQRSDQSYSTFTYNPVNYLRIAQCIINKNHERSYDIIDAMLANVEDVLLADITSLYRFKFIIAFMKHNDLILSKTLLLDLLHKKLWNRCKCILDDPELLNTMDKPSNINTLYIIMECNDMDLIKSLMNMIKFVSGFGLVKLFEIDINKFMYVISTGKVNFKNVLQKYNDPVAKDLFEYMIDTKNVKMFSYLLNVLSSTNNFELMMGLVKVGAHLHNDRIIDIVKDKYKNEFVRMYLVRNVASDIPEVEKEFNRKIYDIIIN